MKTLNLGILAHVDAGKTSLTERLLYTAGVIDELGSVDRGNTQTDSLALERQRGITIKSAVASFPIGDITVNLIDTPGHPDFIAEVERVLSVLDGAVLVISAVEGIQAQTRVLMRALRRLRIPTLIFINKIDRTGARPDAVLRDIAEKLAPNIAPIGVDLAEDAKLIEVLAENSDAMLSAYLNDVTTISRRWLRRELADQARRALVLPIFFGSAITGAGVDSLMSGIARLLPTAQADAEGPVSGTVFKVERGPGGEKVAYVRMFSGTIRTRDRLGEEKVTAVSGGGSVSAGQIAKLWGLRNVRIGDHLGLPHPTPHRQTQFAPPSLETVVVARRPADKGALHSALTQLAEQDPLINLRVDELRQEISVSLYGEVQKEVIQATLADDFGIPIAFRETTTICVERPAGSGAAAEFLGEDGNPFLATVGLRLDPAPPHSGFDFRMDVAVESMPLFVFKAAGEYRAAVEETIRQTLRQGIYGWQVTDCVVTMTHSGYTSPGSTPADALPAVMRLLASVRGIPQNTETSGATVVMTGDIPAARVHRLQQRLPSVTRGEGALESAFHHYVPVRGEVPSRPRPDQNPLNRKEYLLHVLRRV